MGFLRGLPMIPASFLSRRGPVFESFHGPAFRDDPSLGFPGGQQKDLRLAVFEANGT
jgi:hypothetical protein